MIDEVDNRTGNLLGGLESLVRDDEHDNSRGVAAAHEGKGLPAIADDTPPAGGDAPAAESREAMIDRLSRMDLLDAAAACRDEAEKHGVPYGALKSKVTQARKDRETREKASKKVPEATTHTCFEFTEEEIAARSQTKADDAQDTYPDPDKGPFPTFRTYGVDTKKPNGKFILAGTYLHDIDEEEAGEDYTIRRVTDERIASPVWITADTCTPGGGNYGQKVEYVDRRTGERKAWGMPDAMLVGDVNVALKVFASEGVKVAPDSKKSFLRFLSQDANRRLIDAATMTGWHEKSFVLPDEVIGDAENIWYQSATRRTPYAKAGTLEGWKENVAKYAAGNPMMTVALSMPFVGPLLRKVGAKGGGVHKVGDSSTGKTTLAAAAASAFGNEDYVGSWRATSNGLEGVASRHSDTLLVLDEVGQVKPDHLGEAVYMLWDGKGKDRADSTGAVRDAARWRVSILSTGEIPIATHIARGNVEAKAGQTIRILDVPCARKYGVFDDLHGFQGGADLSIHICEQAKLNFGTAGPAFIRALVANQESAEPIDLPALLKKLKAECFPHTSSQEGRAARFFALVGMAGELATEWGIVPWANGQAIEAAQIAYETWKEFRGDSANNSEHVEILRKLRDFFDVHGRTRFDPFNKCENKPVSNSAGFVQTTSEGTFFWLTNAGVKAAVPGFDTKRVIEALVKAGAVSHLDSKGSFGQKKPPYTGVNTRLIRVDPTKLDTAQGDGEQGDDDEE
jgi:putative DNA primase/helicase